MMAWDGNCGGCDGSAVSAVVLEVWRCGAGWLQERVVVVVVFGWEWPEAGRNLRRKIWEAPNLINEGCVFRLKNENDTTGMRCTPRKEIELFKPQMKDKFEMSDLGLLAYYLGIEVTQKGGKITIRQTGYINKILKDASMLESNDTKIPMDPGTKLVKAESGNSVDATYYRSLIGCLRYLLHTRPDLSYSVGILNRFMKEPKDHHLKAIKQVIRYIKGTKDHGIIYKKDGGFKITGYSDSSYGVNTDQGKGTTGIVFYFGESPITCNETDYHSLLSFKSTITHDPDKVLTSWNDSFHFYEWSGGIPSFLGNITSMEVFSCVENPLGGSIPDTLGLWKSLTTFYSGGCNLYGSIPRSIFNLSLLVNLSLAENHLTASLPQKLQTYRRSFKNKAIMEGIIDEDDESHHDGWRRWDDYENAIPDHEEIMNVEHRDNERCELFDQERPIFNIRRFEMIKYSFGDDEEYVAVKEDEYCNTPILTNIAAKANLGYYFIV
nr:ribonuclease H-like domain, reverse transcriptase, RNA-dependent DNA polymerase [Tanacetum cinerariifolium]